MSTGPPLIDLAVEVLGYTGADGLVVAGGRHPTNLATRFMWEELVQRVKLDAVFFHSGIPLLGFTTATASDLRSLRAQLWNYGRLPALVAVSGHENATVYNALRSPTSPITDASILAHGSLRGDSPALGAFERNEVESGTWARTFSGAFQRSDRVDAVLLSNLRILRGRIAATVGPRSLPHVDIVIGASILAAYMSDRGVLTPGHMGTLCGKSSLLDCLASGKQPFKAMLVGLAQRFNGDVFGPASESVGQLDDHSLAEIGNFLGGENLGSRQTALWPYDFSAIPPEVISSVYETLLEEDRDKHASFYTPRSVVNLVLDEVVPLEGHFEGTIADLSCGSGAFVTEAFRRLVFQRRTSGEVIDIHGLSQLMRNQIFGVDVDDFAARLTVFGLYLALLEEVEPRTVWDEVILPPLYMRNIISADAFTDHPLRNRRFDAIVGNPPWQSSLSSASSAFLRSRRRTVGDKQIAQAFVWLAEEMVVDGGRIGFVLPAKTLYNRSGPNVRFRTELLQRSAVRTIVDLSLVRRDLFSGATAPSVVVIAETGDAAVNSESPGAFLAVRPRVGSTIVDGFVVAPEDFQEFSATASRQPDFPWKALLWGSERDTKLLRILRTNFDSLGVVAARRGWSIAQGIKVSGAQHDAHALAGLPNLRQNLGQLASTESEGVFERDTLHRSQPREFFVSPKIVIARTLSRDRLAVALLSEPFIFTSNLTGIVPPSRDFGNLPLLGLVAASSLIQYWQFFTSASWGVERPSVETNEILSWPTPPLASESAVQARRILNEISRDGLTDTTRGLVDDFVFDLYGLTTAERDLVLRGVERSLWSDRPDRLFGTVVSDETLTAYQAQLVKILETGWRTAKLTSATMRSGGYAGVKIHFASTEPSIPTAWTSEEWIRAIGSLGRQPSTTALVSQPSLLFFESANVYLIKTLDADRWSVGAAIGDGDAVYAAAVFGDHLAY